MDLDVASSENLWAGIISYARNKDSISIVRAGFAVIRQVDLVFIRAGAVYRNVTEQTRLGPVIITDDCLHIDCRHLERLQRSVIVILLMPGGDSGKRHLGVPAEGSYVPIQRSDPAAVAD